MIRLALLLVWLAAGAQAQARIDPDRSAVRDGWFSLAVTLGVSDIVPYRIFTLDDPRRLVLELQGVDWGSTDLAAILEQGRATGLRVAQADDGWSRLEIDLARPLEVDTAAMTSTPQGAVLEVVLGRTSAAEFAATARQPDLPAAAPTAPAAPDDGVLTVVLDPGHGGIDPGATRGDVAEADLMLALAREVAQALAGQPDMRVVLTRDSDVFVPLNRRITIARDAGADLLVSLHADALAEDAASGASVYTLAPDDADGASQRIVTHHARSDLLEGVDLQGRGDRVATILLDLARRETSPQADAFAAGLVAQMQAAGASVNVRPRRSAQLAVLGAADFPSVLVEAGFLSNSADRAQLSQPAGRAPLVRAIAAAVVAWRETGKDLPEQP